tara:strand:- start:1642 stop:1821 length:180 start_codon:yes stop_codon:yes gene_type:complete
MINRYFNISKDFNTLNDFENEIMPIINEAKFNSKEDKEKVINWSRKTFFNQWKQRGERR